MNRLSTTLGTNLSTTIRTTRGIQQTLIAPPCNDTAGWPAETKGVVYTKRWVVDLLLDLVGYRAERNLVEAVAVEPAAGDGAFLGPIVERLAESCERLGRPISDSADSLIAYELDDASAVRARDLAAGTLVRHGVSRSEANRLAARWVRTGDYLFSPPGYRPILLLEIRLTCGWRTSPKQRQLPIAVRTRRCEAGPICMSRFLKLRFIS